MEISNSGELLSTKQDGMGHTEWDEKLQHTEKNLLQVHVPCMG